MKSRKKPEVNKIKIEPWELGLCLEMIATASGFLSEAGDYLGDEEAEEWQKIEHMKNMLKAHAELNHLKNLVKGLLDRS